MRIEYFVNKDGKMDNDALKGGVYRVDLASARVNGKVIPLYVGEAGCIVKRCGVHLMMFSNNPEYFGLRDEDVEDDALVLRFYVARSMATKIGRYDPTYIAEENTIKGKVKPLTQNDSENSDNMRPIKHKMTLVQQAMIEKGFKTH